MGGPHYLIMAEIIVDAGVEIKPLEVGKAKAAGHLKWIVPDELLMYVELEVDKDVQLVLG